MWTFDDLEVMFTEMRSARILGEGPLCYYHVMSRVIERRFIFDDEGREYFRRTMRSLEKFCGVRVVAWTCLSNHFHILVAVPDRESSDVKGELADLLESDEAFLGRAGCLYKGEAFDELSLLLQQARAVRTGDDEMEKVRQIKKPYLDRMFSLSAFVGELKQRVSQWYNKKEDRHGPLWEDRFKSVLVQGEPGVLATVAAYIDLNSIRAGIVKDPRDWRWCGYAEAVAADGPSRMGIYEVLAESREGAEEWRSIHQRYRRILFNDGQQRLDSAGKVIRKGFSGSQMADVDCSTFDPLLQSAMLLQRVRHFSNGGALGSERFVDKVFARARGQMKVKRSSGARLLKGVPGGEKLRTLCDLRSERAHK